eukprot:CAMPEP_0180810214 /NCGR_PEP_ID=MMETSP1038_2-20121128/64759_1 /TAXON_ID=632150 /ORGANISM="Azadinium spinosum, Strain 3D9" /LENGTH=64 /DNA_ID=CAMNT_0022851477 /DNA_START=39 /DNA_END=233 /DNA_ORIENTATION=-
MQHEVLRPHGNAKFVFHFNPSILHHYRGIVVLHQGYPTAFELSHQEKYALQRFGSESKVEPLRT